MGPVEQLARRLWLEDPEVQRRLDESGVAAGSIAVLEDGFVNVVVSKGYPPGLVAAFQRFPLTEPVPLAEAIRTGRSIWITGEAEWDSRYPSKMTTYRSSSVQRGLASIPFEGRGLFGAIGISFVEGQRLSDEIKGQAQALAQLIGNALGSAHAG